MGVTIGNIAGGEVLAGDVDADDLFEIEVDGASRFIKAVEVAKVIGSLGFLSPDGTDHIKATVVDGTAPLIWTTDSVERGRIIADDNGMYFELLESAVDPGVPAANTVRLFSKDDGNGDSRLYRRNTVGVSAMVDAAMFGGVWDPTVAMFVDQGGGGDDDAGLQFSMVGAAGARVARMRAVSDPLNVDAYAELVAGEAAGVDLAQLIVNMGAAQEGTALPGLRVRNNADATDLLNLYYTAGTSLGLDLQLADLNAAYQADLWVYNTDAGLLLQGSGTSLYLANDANGPFVEMTESAAAPAAPAANGVRLYAVDTAGKTTLMALFSSGAGQQIAIQL